MMMGIYLAINNLWKTIERSLNSQDFKNLLVNKFADIAYNYQKFLNSYLPVKSVKESIIPIDKEIQPEGFDRRTGLFIDELKQYFDTDLSDFIIFCFIHGSIATNDYTGFSDFDAGLIIKNEVMLNPESLKELQKRLRTALKIVLKFDNLQHHGFFIIPEKFLNFYPEDYLPLDVLRHSRTLNKPLKLKITSHRNPEWAKEKFLKVVTVFGYKFKKPRNLYEVKHLLSQFMILPTLYLQAKGVYVYKKYSFDMVKREFPEEWWVMEEVSKIREDWVRPEARLFEYLVDKLPNPWMVSLIYRKFYWKIPQWLSKRLDNKIYNGIKTLSQKMIKGIF